MHPRGIATRIAGPGAGILLALGLAACSATPTEYTHPGEVPEGPGIFTGEEGSVGLATAEADGRQEKRNESDGSAAGCACPDGEELQAYREFLRWKAEAVGTPEYREFQQWREWRRQRSGSE